MTRDELLARIEEAHTGAVYCALRIVVESCFKDGYTTWDVSMVPLIDGVYDTGEMAKWEKAHGHDIRLKCYPEFCCQLYIDPQDLIELIEKELGVTNG